MSLNQHDSQRRSALRKFVGDLAVNVLSNLIAAAIIYVLGVAVGVFPSSIYFYLAIILLGSAVAGLLLLLLSSFYRGRPKELTYGSGSVLLSLAGLAIIGRGAIHNPDTSTFEVLVVWLYVSLPGVIGLLILAGLRWPKLSPFPSEAWEEGGLGLRLRRWIIRRRSGVERSTERDEES